ncbi:PREDICTED: ATP-dependent DNA helicase Q1-like [Amphimedon queenslandica]|nr:PREDICTED: ATP-dependent DNA helicase Q1-like [Amphimedon queenslandica]XP_019861739.1 PREDICTED: ATP-dependent DNA helicase Q1-like [Amphimedon queenslandica]|eukprot:XP_019861738.1 PREDICTED: ATP-dependent DNA helicase Q1-like [Amphimedon queenslandica]
MHAGDSIAIIVCPLKALMKDQTSHFRDIGISAAFGGEPNISMDRFIRGEFQLIFLSPECLNRGRAWREILKSNIYQERVIAFVVDEAHLIKNWGDDYRPEFSKLGEIGSLLPQQTNVMALTATATTALRDHVIKILGMKRVSVVEVSPGKDNLFFSIKEFKSIGENFIPLMKELKDKKLSMERTLIFCRRPIDCAELWSAFIRFLKDDITEPPGLPLKIPEVRLVDYYTGCTQEAVRNVILSQFSKPSCLRVVIATVAFGLGVDCPDIRRVIHFGVPEDVETYVQQVGRAGRDGKLSSCVMLYGPGVYRRFSNDHILAYCKSKDTCRRDFLYSMFSSYNPNERLKNTCSCCDVCFQVCSCSECQFSQ